MYQFVKIPMLFREDPIRNMFCCCSLLVCYILCPQSIARFCVTCPEECSREWGKKEVVMFMIVKRDSLWDFAWSNVSCFSRVWDFIWCNVMLLFVLRWNRGCPSTKKETGSPLSLRPACRFPFLSLCASWDCGFFLRFLLFLFVVFRIFVYSSSSFAELLLSTMMPQPDMKWGEEVGVEDDIWKEIEGFVRWSLPQVTSNKNEKERIAKCFPFSCGKKRNCDARWMRFRNPERNPNPRSMSDCLLLFEWLLVADVSGNFASSCSAICDMQSQSCSFRSVDSIWK